MKKKFENGLFIYRRDFRTVDNTGLNLLSRECNNVYAIFIFTPEQVGSGNNFKSNNAVQFMIESLEDLAGQIKRDGGRLVTFYGHNENVIPECIAAWNIEIVSYNLDCTPYARKRDDFIFDMCMKKDVIPAATFDYYLLELGSVTNSSGSIYQKFTPYYNAALKKKVDEPAKATHINFANSTKQLRYTISLADAMKKFVPSGPNPNILVHGGRAQAIKQLRNAMKSQQQYAKNHNQLSKPTSQLSAYIKFGCLSIREMYKAFRRNRDLVRQLYWRDFYANVLLAYPHVLHKSLKSNYDKVKWHHNKRFLTAWQNGETGFPVVDACMKQLNTTGYLHNRGRLIVASFLVKTLLIDWREGERYFATQLTDYDVASNNGNWGWISGSGADSQPWFRIFNPWEQSKNYDANCEYIKHWLPQLSELDSKTIHNWNTQYVNYKKNNKNNKTSIDYPEPICDYKIQKELAMKMYEDAFKS